MDIPGLGDLIDRYKADPESVYNSWFVGSEARMKLIGLAVVHGRPRGLALVDLHPGNWIGYHAYRSLRNASMINVPPGHSAF